MPLTNCEITLDLIWSANCVICEKSRVKIFAMIDAKLYVPVVNLSTQDNPKPLQQLKSGFKRTINCILNIKSKNTITKLIFRLLNCSKLSRNK